MCRQYAGQRQLPGIGREQAALGFAPEELALEPLVFPLQVGFPGLQPFVLAQERDNHRLT